MTYQAQAQLTKDHHLIDRIAACAATQGVREAGTWAARNMWPLSASEGWAAAYAAATQGDPPVDPADWSPRAGADPGVITDEMILKAVQKLLRKEQP